MMRRRWWLAAWAAVTIATAGIGAVGVVPAAASGSKINGSGSTYVGLAMQQWVADGQTRGLSVNYLPTGSPQGLTEFANTLTDFAGTEAEFSALSSSTPPRGFQYVPDVAGAVAIMYNAVDRAGRKVDYLHLSRLTVARIFMGDIARWSDPAIAADNKGLLLPDEAITVVFRAGQSGTTALFYDFVAHAAPDIFARWAASNKLPTSTRIISLDGALNFAPNKLALSGSDQIAQSVASSNGRWEIAYDEFGYAKTYNAPAAWIDNASGFWVLPYAANISAALESARLRPDLSQELSGVYTSPHPLAYPISAYSYIVTQCSRSGDRPTCAGPYTNPGVAETLAKWMRYIACEGQVSMGQIGYSPLPANLSQEMANSIGRLLGTAPEQLNAGNCANPRFSGSLGAQSAASPADPLAHLPAGGGAVGGSAPGGSAGARGAVTVPGPAASASTGGAGTAAGGGQTQGTTGGSGGASDLSTGAAQAVGGGSNTWRVAAPVMYGRPAESSGSIRPLVIFAAFLCLPPLLAWLRRLR